MFRFINALWEHRISLIYPQKQNKFEINNIHLKKVKNQTYLWEFEFALIIAGQLRIPTQVEVNLRFPFNLKLRVINTYY